MTQIKTALITSIFFFCVGIQFTPHTAFAETIKWRSYKEGMVIGKKQEKQIFLNFYAKWCAYCVKMEKETFKDPIVINYLNKYFIPIKINADKEKQIALQYHVMGLPVTWFLTKKGEKISYRPGFIPANTLLQILKYIQTNSFKKMTFIDFTKKNTHKP